MRFLKVGAQPSEYLINFHQFIRASLVAQLAKNPPAVQETPARFLAWEDPLEKGLGYPLQYSWTSPVAQLVKNPPAMQETCVQSLGGKIPGLGRSLGQQNSLEKGMATQSMECIVHGQQRVSHNCATFTHSLVYYDQTNSRNYYQTLTFGRWFFEKQFQRYKISQMD